MSLARADDDALARLERGVAEAATEPLVRISGVIAEVSLVARARQPGCRRS